MEVCRQKVPPLFRTDPFRAASCFLHQQAPAVPSENVDDLLAQKAGVGPGS
jgi:hypothetical protein